MVLQQDPFVGESSTEPKKRAFLVGRSAGSKDVFFLAKLALYRGQSINCYHLVTGERRRFSGRSAEAFNRMREEFINHGHEIRYPPDIPEGDVKKWVEHGRNEARRLGLTIHDWPFQPVND